jgi:methyl-accepting chemotaxis protein
MNLKTKILVPTVVLITLSIIISTMISYTSVKETIFHLSEARLQETVASAGARLNDQIEALLAETGKLADYKDVQKATRYKGLRSKAASFFKAYAADRPYFEALVLTDAQGMAIAASNDTQDLDVSGTPFFTSAMAGKIRVSSVEKATGSGTPVFFISVPVKMNNKVAGVMLGQVRLSALGDKFIKPLTAGNTGYGYLVSDKGQAIYHPDAGKQMALDISTLDYGRVILGEKNGFTSYREGGQDWLVGFSRIQGTGWTLALTVSSHELMQPARKLRSLLMVIGLVSILVLGVGIFGLIQKFVVSPLGAIRKELKDIAQGEGDLTQRMEILSKDEIGDLSLWFNAFIEKLEQLVRELKGSVVSVSDFSGSLSTLSSTMKDGARDVAGQVESLAGEADNVTMVMNSVAASVEQASTNISTVSEAAGELNASISGIAGNSEQSRTITGTAVTRSRQASEKIGQLNDATGEIIRMTGVISDISEQTNLLALNATIEAARAGEAGKGFAVVASEIKDLAGQTAKATEEIKQTVETIRSSTDDSVAEIVSVSQVIEEVSQMAGQIADAVDQQSSTTAQIADNIAQASTGLGEVNHSIAQASAAARNMAQGISKVSETAGEFSEISEDVDAKSRDLSGISKDLGQSVSGFKVSDRV